MEKGTAVPWHVTPLFVKEGVTVTVAVTGAEEVFAAMKGDIFPDPLAANPMVILLFDHA